MLTEIGKRVKNASVEIAVASTDDKNKILKAIANALRENCDEILKANAIDLETGRNNGMSEALLDRLILNKDRVEAMATELKKLGCNIEIFEDSVVIKGGILPPTQILNGHNDHRIVMALSILLTLTGGEIEGCEAVNKSYPHFFKDLEALGVTLERTE
jgi:hypothetical protein